MIRMYYLVRIEGMDICYFCGTTPDGQSIWCDSPQKAKLLSPPEAVVAYQNNYQLYPGVALRSEFSI